MTKKDSGKESWGKYGESLYKHWVRTYGNKYVDRWLKKHKYDIKSCDTPEFIEYMMGKFLDWINRD